MKFESTSRNTLPLDWWPLVGAIGVLYLPTYWRMVTGLWHEADQVQAPLLFVLALFTLWQQRDIFRSQPPARTWPLLGSMLLGLGLLMYLVGRSQDILIWEAGSQLPVFAGIVLALFGARHLKTLQLSLVFLALTVPLPSTVIDALTMPMKMAVSHTATDILFWFGYPIGRAGVVLQIGAYQLLVADACAGMHTLISLEVLGLIYLHLVRHESLLRNVVLAILIIPISFAANVIRVLVLILVTYHFGDAAGQSFVHEFAGLVLFVVALMLVIGIDRLLQTLDARWSRARGKLSS